MKLSKKETILASILQLFISSYCFSQPAKYRDAIRSQNKHTLDSLYPRATGIILREFHVVDTAQLIDINCNCPETKGAIELTFDTNGNLINKEVYYNDMKNLPDTLAGYIKKNISKHVGFYNNYMSKSINNKGEISYGIWMWKETDYGGNWIIDEYILKFDRLGNFLSKKEVPKGIM